MFSDAWQEYFEQADKAIISGKYTEAISKYLKGVNYAGKDNVGKKHVGKAWDDLGFAYFQLGKYSSAINYLKKSISDFPENFNARLYLGACYFSTNETRLALDELNYIEKNIYFDDRWIFEINNVKLINEYGDEIPRDSLERIRKEKGIYLDQKKADANNRIRAIFYIDAFNAINEGALYYLQGCVFSKLGDQALAEIKFKKAIQAGYDERDVKIQLLNLYLKHNETVNEQKIAAEIEKQTIQSREIRFKIQHRLVDHNNNLLGDQIREFLKTLETGKIEAAIKKLEDGLLINEKAFPINHNLALLYFDVYQADNSKLEELEKAEIFCARALWYKDYQTVNKDDIIGCHDLMGNIYSAQKELEKSLKEFKKILEFDQQNTHAHYNLGVGYYYLKDFDNAENEWKKAIEFEIEVINREKDISTTSGNRLNYSIIVRRRKNLYLCHLALGNLYFDQQLIDKAIPELETAVEISPKEAAPHFNLAKSYKQINAIEKAIFHLEKYIYLGGEKEKEAKKLLEQLKKALFR